MIHVRVPMYDEMPFAARTTYESIGLDDVSHCELRVLLVVNTSDYFQLIIGRLLEGDSMVGTLVNETHEDYIVTDSVQTLDEYFMQAWRAWAEDNDTTVQFGQGDATV